MLCGNAPFYGQSLSTEEIMERIRAGQFSFDAPEWVRVSQAAKSIIEGVWLYQQEWITCSHYVELQCIKFGKRAKN